VTIILGGDSLNKTIPHERTGCEKSVLFHIIFNWSPRCPGVTEWRLHWGPPGLSFAFCLFIAKNVLLYCVFVVVFFVFIKFYFLLFLLF